MDTVNVRYIVDDVGKAIDFYCKHLDFEVKMHPAPGFAALKRGPLQLLLNAPGAGGAGTAMDDGALPQPGGWNRIQLQVDNLDDTIARLEKHGAHFRNQMVRGNGGKQILLEDPAGNLVELFDPFNR